MLCNLVTGALAGLTIFICLGPASLSVKAELNGDNIKGDVSVKSGSKTPPGADIAWLCYWYESNTINNRFGDQINISRIDRRQVTGSGATATFDSTGLQPGSYNVKCNVTD